MGIFRYPNGPELQNNSVLLVPGEDREEILATYASKAE
jgi:hypothetical protein